MKKEKTKQKKFSQHLFCSQTSQGHTRLGWKKDLDIVLYYKDLSNDEWWRRLADRLGGLPAQAGRILLLELFCEANASLQQLKKKVPQGCENPQIESSVVSWYSIFIIFLWACFLLTISIAKGVKFFTFTRLY